MIVALKFIVMLMCVLGSAFFAGIETGIIAMNRLRLRHLVQHRVPGARLIEDFLRRPDILLGTTLVGTNLCHVAVAVLATSLAESIEVTGAVTAANVLVIVILLIFGEYIPKAWFQSFPSHRVLPFARALWVSSWVLLPLRWTIAEIVRLMMGRRAPEAENQPLITREEFMHLAREGGETGALTPVETRMIKGVFELSGTRCGDIMVPRDRMLRVEQDLPVAGLVNLARNVNRTRFPVWDPAVSKFVGVVHVFDALADEQPEGKTVAAYMRHPQFVNEHTLVDHVMPRMRVTRQPLMLVTNDVYEVTGLITLDDVLHVIVGGGGPAHPSAHASPPPAAPVPPPAAARP